MKAKHALIHDTFTLERRYLSAPAKVYRPQMRVHGIGEQLDLLGRVLQKDQD